MGVKESAAVRARQREVAARIERLIDQADQRAPIGSQRRARIRNLIREGRVALRRRDRAERDIEAATDEIGRTLTGLVDEGLKHFEAFEALGVSIGVGRRLLREAQHRRDNPETKGGQ
ncbi:MAG: hypothetical protein ACSLEW_13960 [Nocardioides sp.]